jgi:hypothetical protein
MSKILFTELPIDVKGLIEALYKMYCSGKQDDLSELKKHIQKESSKLKANIQGAIVKDFLLQLKPVFRADGDLQHQLLMTQFVKEALESPERELFKAHLAAISHRVISKKMKEVIYSDLK